MIGFRAQSFGDFERLWEIWEPNGGGACKQQSSDFFRWGIYLLLENLNLAMGVRGAHKVGGEFEHTLGEALEAFSAP